MNENKNLNEDFQQKTDKELPKSDNLTQGAVILYCKTIIHKIPYFRTMHLAARYIKTEYRSQVPGQEIYLRIREHRTYHLYRRSTNI